MQLHLLGRAYNPWHLNHSGEVNLSSEPWWQSLVTEHFPLIPPNYFNLIVASPAAWQILSSVTHVHGSATVWGRSQDCQTDIVFLRQSRSSPPHSALLEMCWPLQMAPIEEVLPPMLKRHPISIHVCIMHYHCLADLNTVIVHWLFCVSLWCYIRNLIGIPNTLNNLCSHLYLTLISLLSALVFSIFFGVFVW